MGRAPFLIVGLGNPGPAYAQTRHNAGFWFVDRLAGGTAFRSQKKLHGDTAAVTLGAHDVLLCKPDTFMNESGRCVRALLDWYKLPRVEAATRLLVVHDELDLPPGRLRLKADGGHGGHNGLRSIHQHLGTDAYLRLRIGVGHPGMAAQVTGWLTQQRLDAAQRAEIEAHFERAEAALPALLDGDPARAMNALHRDG
jgi:PTH1 family peptidyl-tRNA hydrolase